MPTRRKACVALCSDGAQSIAPSRIDTLRSDGTSVPASVSALSVCVTATSGEAKAMGGLNRWIDALVQSSPLSDTAAILSGPPTRSSSTRQRR